MAQDANFQTRSMLMPVGKLNQKRKDDIKLLKSLSVTLDVDGKQVKNVVLVNHVSDDPEIRCWIQDPLDQEKWSITNHFVGYADSNMWFDDERLYYDMDDKEWYDDSLCGFVGGFDHIGNYLEWQNKKQFDGKDINIVDSILVLETIEGKFNLLNYDVSKIKITENK